MTALCPTCPETQRHGRIYEAGPMPCEACRAKAREATPACGLCAGTMRHGMIGGAGTVPCLCRTGRMRGVTDLDPAEEEEMRLRDALRAERAKSARLELLAMTLHGTPEERAAVIERELATLQH